jgi:hypothetical protein
MPKTQNKQATVSNLKLPERVTLAVCIVAIAAAFALMGVFFTFSWMFFLILIADLAVLVTGRLSDTTKRLTLFISVIGAVVALLFAIASHPWIFR